MDIRFTCPVCKKNLKVRQELAGKRVKCAACQKPVQVPAAPPPAATPAHAEELAAQVFSDQPKPIEEKKPEGAPISINCFYCDDVVSFPAELAGKQAPCPSCRRIIKVPLPVKEAPKDWRTVQHKGPSAAKQNIEPAPEGVWSASYKSNVSEESLYEADVLVDEVEPLSRQEKVRWGIMIVVGVVILAGVGAGGWHIYSANAQDKAFRRAMQFVDKEQEAKTSPEIAAEVHRLAGEYYLRSGNLSAANEEFRKARSSLARARPGSMERDAELIDLALSQVDLGGTKAQAQDRTRLKWEDAQTELRQTLQRLSTFEARALALRLVARKLVMRGEESAEAKQELRGRMDVLARLLSAAPQELPELHAIVGLEVFRTDPKHAEELAREAAQPYAAPPPPANAGAKAGETPPANVQKPPVAPSLLALFVALQQEAKAFAILPPPPAGARSVVGEARLGYAVGAAHQGKWDYALWLAQIDGDPNQRLETLVGVAEVALEKSPEEAKRIVTAAIDLCEAKKPTNSPWAVRQLARVGVRAGMNDKVQATLDKLQLPSGIKSEVQLESYRARFDMNTPAEITLLSAEVAQKPQAHPRTVAFLSRQCGSSAVIAAAGTWEPEALRALAYIGAALSMQDAALGTQQVTQKR